MTLHGNDLQHQSGLRHKINKLLGFVNGGRERLLHEHVLARLQGSRSDRIVEPIRGSDQHGLDGLGLIPLGVQIRLGEIGAEGSAGGGLVERGDGGVAGFLGRRQNMLLVLGEPYSNRQSLSLVVSSPKLRKSVRSHYGF